MSRTLGNLVISIVKNELNVPNTMILNLTIKNITLKNPTKNVTRICYTIKTSRSCAK